MALGLAVLLAGCAAPREPTFLPGAPKPGDVAYDADACGGDHGMAEQWFSDLNGRPRLGPPEMSICP